MRPVARGWLLWLASMGACTVEEHVVDVSRETEPGEDTGDDDGKPETETDDDHGGGGNDDTTGGTTSSDDPSTDGGESCGTECESSESTEHAETDDDTGA